MFVEFAQRIFGVGVAKIGGAVEIVRGSLEIGEDALQRYLAKQIDRGGVVLRGGLSSQPRAARSLGPGASDSSAAPS